MLLKNVKLGYYNLGKDKAAVNHIPFMDQLKLSEKTKAN